MKRFLILILAVSMLLPCFVGCGKTEKESGREDDEREEAQETEKEDALAAAEVTVSKDKLAEPAEITFDLSDKDIEDPSDLTLVRFEEKEDGTVEMVVLGGTYNEEDQTFTGLVTTSGTYAVVSMENLIRIRLQIDNVNAYINEVLYVNDVAPVIVNGRTMVPLRFIAEAFGASLAWNEPTKTVTIVFNGQVLKLTIDQPIAGFDTPAQIVNDRTMVPIRYISESFGAVVTWVPSTQTVHIVK